MNNHRVSPQIYLHRNILLLLFRAGLAYITITNGSSFFYLTVRINDPKYVESGSSANLSYTLLATCLIKGMEISGGVFIFLGLFTRMSAKLIALTMLIVIVTGTAGMQWEISWASIVLSCLLAGLFIYKGGGKYALDSLIIKSE